MAHVNTIIQYGIVNNDHQQRADGGGRPKIDVRRLASADLHIEVGIQSENVYRETTMGRLLREHAIKELYRIWHLSVHATDKHISNKHITYECLASSSRLATTIINK